MVCRQFDTGMRHGDCTCLAGMLEEVSVGHSFLVVFHTYVIATKPPTRVCNNRYKSSPHFAQSSLFSTTNERAVRHKCEKEVCVGRRGKE